MKLRLNEIVRSIAPSDLGAVAVIAMGLFITFVLDGLAIRLIGVSVSVLGVVALFMLYTQRNADNIKLRAVRDVSQKTDFKTTIRDGAGSKRVVFDDFESSFGTMPDENQTILFDDGFGDDLSSHVRMNADEGFVIRKIRGEEVATSTEPSGNRGSVVRDVQREVSFKTRRANLPPLRRDERVAQRLQANEESSQTANESEGFTIIGVKKKLEIDSESESKTTEITDGRTSLSISNERTTDRELESIPHVDTSSTILDESAVSELHDGVQVDEIVSIPHREEKQTIRLTAVDKNVRKQIDLLIEELSVEDSETAHDEPRKEFDYLLSRVLTVIRSVINARTAVFYWVNPEKLQLVLESHITDSPEHFNDTRKFPLGDDIISNIAVNGRPEILTEIQRSAELELIPYYRTNADTQSFIGVPVYFNNAVMGILCADTTVADAYDSITVGFFGHFTKLISGLIRSYTDKYDLYQRSRALDAIQLFKHLASKSNSTKIDIASSAVETAQRLTEADTFGAILFDQQSGEWKVVSSRSTSESFVAINTNIDLETSLVGATILSGTTQFLAPNSKEVIRLVSNEQRIDGGFFVSVPLKSNSSNYGALYAESKSGGLTQQDVAIIETIGEYCGSFVEQLHYRALIASTALHDEPTGVLNPTAFRERLTEEVERAHDFNTSFTLGLMYLDSYETVEKSLPSDGIDNILVNLIGLLKKHLKVYHVLAMADRHTIAICLPHMDGDSARMWGERTRREIASSVIEISNKRLTVTVSIGLAQVRPNDSLDSLLENTLQALRVSIKKSNAVALFS